MTTATLPRPPLPFVRLLATLLGLALAGVVLKLGRPVLAPLAAGIFLAALAQPLRERLARRVPDWLAIAVASLAILLGVLAFLAALGWSLAAVGSELADRREELRTMGERARAWAQSRGIPVPSGGGGSEPAASGGGAAPAGVAGAVTRALAALGGALGELGLAIAFAVLGLAEAHEGRRRLAHALRGSTAEQTLAALGESAAAFRRYVWVKTATSVLTGVCSGLLALAFGLPLAWVWGFFAFLLEYVPTLGSLLAVVPPTLMALADQGTGGSGGMQRVGLIFGSFAALQLVLGNLVDPRLEGRLMALSPFGVLLSIVVWGWLWGALGALLGVPLTVAIVIASRHVPGMGGVATLLAGDGVDDAGDAASADGSGTDAPRAAHRVARRP